MAFTPLRDSRRLEIDVKDVTKSFEASREHVSTGPGPD